MTDDGGVLCCDCCRSEYRLIAHSYPRNGWHVSAMDSAANYDEPLACDHCARSIIADDGLIDSLRHHGDCDRRMDDDWKSVAG